MLGLHREDVELVLRAGDADIEETALFFICFDFRLLGFFQVLRDLRREDTVDDVEEIHTVVLEALAGVDGREDERAVPLLWLLLQDLPEFLETVDEVARAVLLIREDAEDVELRVLDLASLHILTVTHVLDDAMDRATGALLPQVPHVRLDGADLSLGIGIETAVPERHVPDGEALELADLRDALCVLLAEIRAELVVELHKELAVHRILGEADDVTDVEYDTVREEANVGVPHLIWHAVSFEEVDQWKRALVVTVKNRDRSRAVLRHLQEIAVLGLPARKRNLADLALLRSGRLHVLFVAQGIFLDEAVGSMNDAGIRAEVLFHQEDPGTGMMLLELEKRVGIGRPEAVDALILVADHEEIFRTRREEGDDGVLDLRGVLGLIDTDVWVLLLEMLEEPREALQHGIGIDHLVVVIHELMLPELSIVRLIDPEKLDLHVLFERPDLLLTQHTVLDEGDEGADILQVALGRIAVLDPLVDAGEHRSDALLIGEQRKCGPTALPAAVLDHAGADAVDGAELEPLRHLRSETACEARRHVLRRRHRIGHRQDPLRCDSLTENHVAEPRHEHGRFTRARHRQKKHRALDGLHGALLLLI